MQGWSDGGSVAREARPNDASNVDPTLTEKMIVGNGVRSWVDRSPAHIQIEETWTWQLLPSDVIYRSYMAGQKEPRLASVWDYDKEIGWKWEGALGGRVGIFRYGTDGKEGRPSGFEADIEGAAFPRLDTNYDRDLMSTDFRFGVPLTLGYERYQTKFAFYHLSSHLGDEFMLKNPTYPRINYSRDALVWGHSFYLMDALRLYGEAGWAFHNDGGSEPWEFQFGIDFSPVEATGYFGGSPFLALNVHMRQEVDFGGNFVVQTGWQWRGVSGHLLRLGMQYNTGKSEQLEIFSQTEHKIGAGVWYDY
jgi:hypothetical protein